MSIEALIKSYGILGAGGLSLVVLVWLVIYQFTKIAPLLQTLSEENKTHSEVIKNNTEVLREISNSNENVANALTLINQSFNTFSSIIEKTDNRSELLERELIKISTNIENCSRGR